MASILQYLQDIFASLFALDAKEIERRRELRALYRRLRETGLDYYDRSGKQIQPAFAAVLLEFARLLQPVNDILAKSVCNTDHHLAERYKGFLVSNRLPAAQQEQLAGFTYRGMKDQLEAAPEPRQTLNEISSYFHVFIKVFSGPVYESFDREYAELNRLIHICSHRYQDLLALFPVSPGIKRSAPGSPAGPAAGDKAVRHLLDIYFILEGFQFSEGIGRNIGALIDRLERERAVETHALMDRCLARLERLLKQNLNPDILLTMIRLIKDDPACTPQVCTEQARYLESYVMSLTGHFERDRARIEREISESAVVADLKRLFPSAPLVEVNRYDDKTAARLLSAGFESFTLVKPLMILKNFTLVHYQKKLREAIKKILVEGYFEKKTFQNIFSASFYACEEIRESLRRFEEDISASGKAAKFTAVRIRNYLELHSRGKNVERLLNEQVSGLNRRALKLLDEGICAYYNLGALLEEILADMKLKNPMTVSNLKTLTEKQNRTLVETLEEGAGNLSFLIRILRSFSVLQAASPPPEDPKPAST
jgi:hypothetical protein